MIPNTVIVAGIPYTIRESVVVVIDGNTNYAGSCNYENAIIEIKEDLPNERKQETFIHELLHAILFEAGYSEHDEELVSRASKIMYQVLKDNNLSFNGEPP